MTKWPTYLIERACAPPPPCCSDVIVEDSTPVLFFGNPRAKVATISINPSWREFLCKKNNKRMLLLGSQRRLATLKSLETSRNDHGTTILNECAAYFSKDRNPYNRWFRPLDNILRHISIDGTNASYYDGTACHLDIAQWATLPVWSELGDKHQTALLDNGKPFLDEHFEEMDYRIIIANGITVINQVRKSGLADFEKIDSPQGQPKLYVGNFGSAKFLAWSYYIQSPYCAKRHIPTLNKFVASRSGEGE